MFSSKMLANVRHRQLNSANWPSLCNIQIRNRLLSCWPGSAEQSKSIGIQ